MNQNFEAVENESRAVDSVAGSIFLLIILGFLLPIIGLSLVFLEKSGINTWLEHRIAITQLRKEIRDWDRLNTGISVIKRRIAKIQKERREYGKEEKQNFAYRWLIESAEKEEIEYRIIYNRLIREYNQKIRISYGLISSSPISEDLFLRPNLPPFNINNANEGLRSKALFLLKYF